MDKLVRHQFGFIIIIQLIVLIGVLLAHFPFIWVSGTELQDTYNRHGGVWHACDRQYIKGCRPLSK